MRINRHYGELQDSYLFSTIARRVADYQQAHPEADVIRLGIGDVTRPLCPAVTEALSAAVREMGEKATFRGYGPEQGYDFLILCNPNNPTSSAISQQDLRQLISFCAKKNIFVMIDETYVEFTPNINAITAVPLTREFTNLMVLRGVSKFFAAPGMRLGYGITGNMDFLSKMREKQTPWSLNSMGAFAGEIMLQDEDYIRQTRELILSERTRMIKELKSVPTYKVYPAYANFILLKILKPGLTSYDVFEACIRQGLIIRDCSSFQCLDGEFVRFCIMMPEDNSRLVEVLKNL